MIQVKTHFVNSHRYYNFKQTLIVIFCEQYKYLYMIVTWYFVILLTFVIKLVTLWLLYIQFKKKISSTLLVNQYIQNVLKCVKLKCSTISYGDECKITVRVTKNKNTLLTQMIQIIHCTSFTDYSPVAIHKQTG